MTLTPSLHIHGSEAGLRGVDTRNPDHGYLEAETKFTQACGVTLEVLSLDTKSKDTEFPADHLQPCMCHLKSR